MTDKLSKERRSANMRAIRSKDTKPEIIVRRALFARGYRYRLHAKDLPGKPDIVFRGRRKVIFVHGCFWHLHPDPHCVDSRIPKTRTEYWTQKLRRNVDRDHNHIETLEAAGWTVLVIWACETKTIEDLNQKLSDFMS